MDENDDDDLVDETTDDMVDAGVEEAQVEFLHLPKRPMPPEIQEVFEPISNAVTRLFANRAIFKDLYGTQAAVDVLNKTASGAFYLIGLMFRDDFIIAASRLPLPRFCHPAHSSRPSARDGTPGSSQAADTTLVVSPSRR